MTLKPIIDVISIDFIMIYMCNMYLAMIYYLRRKEVQFIEENIGI